jgi:hypothetical protein
MTLTLLRKELRQHWWAFLVVGAAAFLGCLIILGATLAAGQAGTPFEGLRVSVMLMGVASALVLCHRLVVVEYHAKTQLFLEALPVARWRMVAVKYGLGLTVICLVVGLPFGLACLLGLNKQLVSWRFLEILAARTFSVIWVTYGFCFMMGLLGRYRLALYIGLLLGLGILAESSSLELGRFGPFALLDRTFAYETELFPWAALCATWALGAVFFLAACGLSLTREGSVATLLAEKMSHREKVFITAVLLAFMWAGSTLSAKARKTPFNLSDAVAEQRTGVLVKVASGIGAGDPEAARLARHVASELAGAREYLGLERLPTVFITLRRDLDADRFERGELAKAEGLHVQANFTANDWRDEPFIAWLLRETLVVATDDRVKLESKRWLLDGFPLFWTTRAQAALPLAMDKPLALRALYGTENGFALEDLRGWLKFNEHVGEAVAAGVAWSGLRTLARHQGEDRCRALLRATLGRAEPKDFRVLLHPVSLEELMRQYGGESLQDFFAEWQTELSAARQKLAAELAQVPRIHGTVTFVPLSSDSRKVRFRAAIEPAPPLDARYSFLHWRLPAFDEELAPKLIQREQNSYAQRPEDELPETFARGSRFCSTFALDVPALGCQVISGWSRKELE